MPLYKYLGKLLKRPGGLATNSACCCHPDCAACEAAITGVLVTLSGYVDSLDPLSPLNRIYDRCKWTNLNNTFTLTKVSAGVGGTLCCYSPGILNDPAHPGLLIAQDLSADAVQCYIYKICGTVACNDGTHQVSLVDPTDLSVTRGLQILTQAFSGGSPASPTCIVCPPNKMVGTFSSVCNGAGAMTSTTTCISNCDTTVSMTVNASATLIF